MTEQKENGLSEQFNEAGPGDERALTNLLSKHRGRLRQMISVRLDPRLQGRIDPSDVIQDALLEATTRLESYQRNPKMPFYLWLRFITVQRLLVLHRRHLGTQKRDAGREVSIYRTEVPNASSAALATQLLGRQVSPSQAAQRAECRLRLQRALDAMEPIDREVLVLRHFEELTNSETAQVLEISSTAANNRYVRALRRVKDILANMPGGIDEVLP